MNNFRVEFIKSGISLKVDTLKARLIRNKSSKYFIICQCESMEI